MLLIPIAVFRNPVVLDLSVSNPKATLPEPVVACRKEPYPKAALLIPVEINCPEV